MNKFFVFFSICFFSVSAAAGPHWAGGSVSNITSVKGGMLVRLDAGTVPDNCAGGNAYGWMLIKEENKTMLSVALAMWMAGKKSTTVYTDGLEGAYCVISQFDPHY